MALREAAGGDANMFKAEQRQKKQARQHLKQQQRLAVKQQNQVNLFSFINTKLSGKLIGQYHTWRLPLIYSIAA